MRRFTQLFIELDRTTRTSEKVAAMERYFREAPAEDAAWALFFLSGRKLKRLVPYAILDQAIEASSALPSWLIGESYEAVGDGAELLALLYPHEPAQPLDEPLHRVVEQRMLALRTMADPAQQIAAIQQSWHEMDFHQRLVFNKLITINFRVGAAQTLIIRALASVAGVDAAVMAHRFAGAWQPTVESFTNLLLGSQSADASSQPYPMYLAYPLDDAPQSLGDLEQWQIEWKYDGTRAQLISRANQPPLVWSRGDELVTHSFPEIAQAAAELPAGTVLDGEIVAWENERPLPFALLQRRLNRKSVEPSLFADVPVAFLAFDLLEENGADLRDAPLAVRRAKLEHVVAALGDLSAIRLAPLLKPASWADVERLRAASRERGVEGVMIKRRDSVYGVGRKRGEWWKWKIDPFTVDAVLIYAQGGSGKRAGVFTDYTFGVWDKPMGNSKRELIPVAKAYSGLTDAEIREVDRFIRHNTLERHGPVRVVKPQLVFELAFEGLAESSRHRAELALRFPRMNRWRKDKPMEEADSLDTLRALMRQTSAARE